MVTIIDRRLNPSGKNLVNRQRFFTRTRKYLKKEINDVKNNTSIKTFGKSEGEDKTSVSINKASINEPSFHFDYNTGDRNFVLPGNTKNEDELLGWVEGDVIPKPKSSGGNGRAGSPDDEGKDDYRFILSEEELNNLYFEDLELPNEEERMLKETDSFSWERAGYSIDGSPSNFALIKTIKNSLGRRIALKRPKKEELLKLQDDDDGSPKYLEELEKTIRRMKSIPYIDTHDVRYNNFTQIPKPTSRSVIFCLMDVSGSMTEHHKDVAKHFFALLYRFLTTKYKQVDVVFIRHDHEAQEVNEETFFYDQKTGGTVVSTAFREMLKIVNERYDPVDWNIYVAQASDGDNTIQDNAIVLDFIKKTLNIVQYFAYLEIGGNNHYYDVFGSNTMHETNLWEAYEKIVNEKFAMKKAKNRKDILPVFGPPFQEKD